VAESVLVNQQLPILNSSLSRSPNRRLSDRIVAGVCALLMYLIQISMSAMLPAPRRPDRNFDIPIARLCAIVLPFEGVF
jgi:hypothetical protein